jgi:hypothetical protein
VNLLQNPFADCSLTPMHWMNAQWQACKTVGLVEELGREIKRSGYPVNILWRRAV